MCVPTKVHICAMCTFSPCVCMCTYVCTYVFIVYSHILFPSYIAILLHFDEADEDKDGKLSFKEFSKHFHTVASQRFFTLLDKSADHLLSKPELNNVLDLVSSNMAHSN